MDVRTYRFPVFGYFTQEMIDNYNRYFKSQKAGRWRLDFGALNDDHEVYCVTKRFAADRHDGHSVIPMDVYMKSLERQFLSDVLTMLYSCI